jgi:GNAT superfamily N-acetyltransferase
MHGRIYAVEYGLGGSFQPDVEVALERAFACGWPDRGGVWLVDHDREIAGTLALIEEEPSAARLRWFLLHASVRGLGLGRRLLGELVAEADAAGYDVIRLETFSELRTAAHLYHSFGFEVIASHRGDRWGRPLTYQEYERRRAPG